jgi:hypothetical protein
MKLRAAQRVVIRQCDMVGFLLLLWRRQFGKSHTLANVALKKMMKRRGCLVTFASASLLVGREIIQKESQVLQTAFSELRKQAAEQKLLLNSVNRDTGKELEETLSVDDFAELFEQQRLEFRLYHDRNVYSRTLVIAPNVATARGFSGHVLLDEIGFIKDFKDLWEAMEPISSSDPDFRVLMATTPPADDAHYSFELTVPPEGMVFPVNEEGNLYTSQAGVLIHRVDVHDGYAAGVKLYDLNTREPLTPQQHRARALDKDAWDRNYGLVHKFGGTAACSLMAIRFAQDLGRDKCAAVDVEHDGGELEGFKLLEQLLGNGQVGIGFDVATTEKEKSNPSSLTVIEKVGVDYVCRLIMRWKTKDPERTRDTISRVLEIVARRKEGGRARRLCIDATSERYFATDLRRALRKLVMVELVISSETIDYKGEEMTVKAFLGNLLVSTIEDGHIPLPSERWVKDDFRLVRRDKGSFLTEMDSAGNHGDSFDSTKLALHALTKRGGVAWAEAAQLSEYSAGSL